MNRMSITLSIEGKAPANSDLRAIQGAVAVALRKAGVMVSTDAVKVEGKLAA